MFAHDLCHSQIEYLRDSIDFNRKDRAKPPARRGCGAYASESDTTNLQYSIVNIQFRLVRVGYLRCFLRAEFLLDSQLPFHYMFTAIQPACH